MNISKHLDKNNLHHAYLIEGRREEIVPKVLEFIKSLGIETTGNADVSCISLDSFKIEDARNLRSYAVERGLTSAKKVFIISANSFLLEAQNSLLKMFEEPILNTHFFLVVPDANSLLKTLVSRFYLIRSKTGLGDELNNAERFITMPLKGRIDFIKELLAEEDENEEILPTDSVRAKSLRFLNNLEFILHKQIVSKGIFDTRINFFSHFFKVREFLRMPGSSAKSLMESVAIATPNF